MNARRREEPVRTGSAVRRAVLTSVLSAFALTSVTITAAAVTLTNATPQPDPPPAAAEAPASSDAAPEVEAELAPPADVADELPVGIPDIVLVSADGPQLDRIPTEAMAAYQRAAAVLGSADKRCHLEWTLLAAVGHVVTQHGTKDDSRIARNGVVRPLLVGKPLRGRTDKRIPDSDAGRLDGDGRFDRPVGPFQLSPATWAVVGVDSDGDGRRNPHDIDDSALAVAVLLCSGRDDLRKRSDRVRGVERINDDPSFIETVLAVDRAYRVQTSRSVPADPFVVPYTPVEVPSDLPLDAKAQVPGDTPTDGPTPPSPQPPSPTATDPVTWIPTPTQPSPTEPPRDPTDRPDVCPTEEPVPTEPPDSPTDVPTDSPTDQPTDAPTDEPTDPAEDPTDEPTDEPTDPAGTKPGCTPADPSAEDE